MGAGAFNAGHRSATRHGTVEKARFYRIARRSAADCSAILDLLGQLEPGRVELVDARVRLARVAAMLTAMVKAVEGGARRK